MALVRGIEDTLTVQFDPRKEFNCNIPREFLEYETDTVRIARIWNDFLLSMNRLCKSRRAMFQNKHLKKSIFNSAMEQLCKEFSRRTESVKASFAYHKSGTQKTYLLTFKKLTEIPESCRNVRFCVAEIPPLEMQAYAQFVSMTDVNTRYDPEVRVAALVEMGNGNSSRGLQGAQATAVEDSASIVSSIRSVNTVSSQQLPQNQQRQQDSNYDYEVNPPIAIAVPQATVQLPVAPDQRSALERMQELESIKSFLSETEFATKRQAILNSI